jgi:dolichol-phosphate mannosyltransferase
MAGLSIDAMLSFSAAPIRLITCMSLLLWAVSLIYLVKSLVEHFILHITVPGWTSIIVMLFFFTGLILFCLSIIGSYIGRIFHQGQKKPLYWLSDARNLDLEKVKLSYGQCHEVLLSEQIVDMKQRRNP